MDTLKEWGASLLAVLGKLDAPAVSTLIGGLIAAAAAWLVQHSATKAARRERLAAKEQADLATAFTTVVKVIKMYSNIQNVRTTLKWAGLRLEMDDLEGAQPWNVLPPFATFPPEVTFDEKEAAFLLSTKINDVILSAIEMVDVYDNMRQLMRVYTDRRVALTIGMPVEVLEGTLGSTVMKTTDFQKLIPQTVPLNNIFQAMSSRVDIDYLQAKKLFEDLRTYCKGRFGTEFPELSIVDPPMPTAADIGEHPEPP